MNRVALGAVRLNTRVDGPEDAPWLVLSNMLGADLSMWEPQMELLTRGYRVLRYDTRGHGGSDAPPGPYGLDDLVEDALELMDHFAIERCAFLGLSIGAMTGMGLGLAHPDRFEGMVLADARADAPRGFRSMWDSRIARVEAGGLDAVLDGMLETWLTEEFRAAHPEETAAVSAMISGTDPAGYIACCEALKRLDYLRRLPELTVPVLYVTGSADRAATPGAVEEVAEATPGARFKVVPNAAHAANINAPEAFNHAIAPFLGLA
jgi:3-oxoadipate enol-lactonase